MQLESRARSKNRRNSAQSPREWTRRYQVYLLAAVSLCLIGAAGLALSRSAAATKDWRGDLAQAAQGAVRNAVRADLRTVFAGMDETRIASLPQDKYMVGGWVDLISEQGEIERQDYSCTIARNGNDDWTIENVTVLPQ